MVSLRRKNKMTDEEIVDLINGLIEMWREDTMNLSPPPDHKHPAFTLIKKIAERYDAARRKAAGYRSGNEYFDNR